MPTSMPVPGLFQKGLHVLYIFAISFSICKVNLHLFPELLQTYFYKVTDSQTPGSFLCYWSCCPSPGFIFFHCDHCNRLDHQCPCCNQNLCQSELLKVTIWTDYAHAHSCHGAQVLPTESDSYFFSLPQGSAPWTLAICVVSPSAIFTLSYFPKILICVFPLSLCLWHFLCLECSPAL